MHTAYTLAYTHSLKHCTHCLYTVHTYTALHCTCATGTEAFPLVVSQLPAALTLYDADLCATVCKAVTVSPAPPPAPFLCLTASPVSTGPARFLGGTASGTPPFCFLVVHCKLSHVHCVCTKHSMVYKLCTTRRYIVHVIAA
jgi:hypothetical protein